MQHTSLADTAGRPADSITLEATALLSGHGGEFDQAGYHLLPLIRQVETCYPIDNVLHVKPPAMYTVHT